MADIPILSPLIATNTETPGIIARANPARAAQSIAFGDIFLELTQPQIRPATRLATPRTESGETTEDPTEALQEPDETAEASEFDTEYEVETPTVPHSHNSDEHARASQDVPTLAVPSRPDPNMAYNAEPLIGLPLPPQRKSDGATSDLPQRDQAALTPVSPLPSATTTTPATQTLPAGLTTIARDGFLRTTQGPKPEILPASRINIPTPRQDGLTGIPLSTPDAGMQTHRFNSSTNTPALQAGAAPLAKVENTAATTARMGPQTMAEPARLVSPGIASQPPNATMAETPTVAITAKQDSIPTSRNQPTRPGGEAVSDRAPNQTTSLPPQPGPQSGVAPLAPNPDAGMASIQTLSSPRQILASGAAQIEGPATPQVAPTTAPPRGLISSADFAMPRAASEMPANSGLPNRTNTLPTASQDIRVAAQVTSSASSSQFPEYRQTPETPMTDRPASTPPLATSLNQTSLNPTEPTASNRFSPNYSQATQAAPSPSVQMPSPPQPSEPSLPMPTTANPYADQAIQPQNLIRKSATTADFQTRATPAAMVQNSDSFRTDLPANASARAETVSPPPTPTPPRIDDSAAISAPTGDRTPPTRATGASMPIPAPEIRAAAINQFETATPGEVKADLASELSSDLRLTPGQTLRNEFSPTRATLPRHVALQLAEALPQAQTKPVEMHLNPEELGRVRLTLSANDSAITVTILAERGETLDLMRRNIGLLADEFRDIGYADIQFAFGQQGQRDEQPTPSGFGTADRETAAVTPAAAPKSTSTPILSDGLDLRL